MYVSICFGFLCPVEEEAHFGNKTNNRKKLERKWRSSLLLNFHIVSGITSCNDALGLESRTVPDSKITASSTKSDVFLPWEARLNGGSSWCAESNDTLSPWIQVSFDKKHRFTGLMIQGSRQELIWVKKYRIEYRLHSMKWKKYPKVKSTGNLKTQGTGRDSGGTPSERQRNPFFGSKSYRFYRGTAILRVRVNIN